MNKNNRSTSIWINFLLLTVALTVLFGAGVYLKQIYTLYGTDKFIYSVVLIAALVIGAAYIFIFIARKLLENDHTDSAKRKKRLLEKCRNLVNYITPFVLIAMLYHFWQKQWVLAIIIVIVLLLDRINDLLRKNK